MKKELTPEQKAKKAACDKQYRKDHKDELAAKKKQYRQVNKVKIAAYRKQYRQEHKDELAAKDKQYAQDNKAGIAARKKRYRQDNKVEIAAYEKQYWQGHKTEKTVYNREYKRGRKANDIDYRLKSSVTTRIGQSIKGNKQCKHSMDLLGCSIPEVREHLEKQFQEGMSWDNWSVEGWHIDHIIPLSYFDFRDYEQQKRAWHYTNLRPLWAMDNIKKKDKIIELQLLLL